MTTESTTAHPALLHDFTLDELKQALATKRAEQLVALRHERAELLAELRRVEAELGLESRPTATAADEPIPQAPPKRKMGVRLGNLILKTLAAMNRDATVDDLVKELKLPDADKPSAVIARTLSRLKLSNVVDATEDGAYRLTPQGLRRAVET
jgi:hypothetical protein